MRPEHEIDQTDKKGIVMEDISLNDLAEELHRQASTATSGRAAHTVYGGTAHHLRQTAIALMAGHGLAEHNSPGEATLQVLSGKVVLSGVSESVELSTGGHVAIPDERHALDALEDSVVLLTVLTQ